MDLVEDAVPAVRRRVHAHFAQIDMLTLMMAFGSVPARRSSTSSSCPDGCSTGWTTRSWRPRHGTTGSSTRRFGPGMSSCSGGSRTSATTADCAAVLGRCPARVGRGSSSYNYPGVREAVVPQELYRVCRSGT